MNTNHSSQHRPLVRAIGALTSLVIAAVAVGCSDVLGPVDSTEIQTTVNSMNESDITNGVIEKEENISNESGNPWGEFIDRAESTCEAPPEGFAVRSASLALVGHRGEHRRPGPGGRDRRGRHRLLPEHQGGATPTRCA